MTLLPRAMIAKNILGELPVLFNPPNVLGKYQSMLCRKGGLNTLNFQQTNIVNVKKLYFFNNLIPQKMCHPALLCHPMYIECLRDLRPKIDDDRIKLYVSRRDAKSRQIVNEVELEHALKELGFTVIVPTEFEAEQQIEFFARAEVIVGSHGAGLTGVFACEKGTHVIEIFNSSKGTAAYANMCKAIGMRYTPVFGSSVGDARNNFRVDVNEIVGIVEQDFN